MEKGLLRINDYHMLSGQPLHAICRYIMFKWARKMLVFRDHKSPEG